MRRLSAGKASRYRFATSTLLAVVIGLPWPAVAAPPTLPTLAKSAKATTNRPSTPRVIDVSLDKNGLLLVQVVTPEGTPLPKTTVGLAGADGKPVVTTTNKQGAFGYRGLKGGVYQLQVGQTHRLARVWAPNTAPPKAARGVLLVTESQAVRGQHGPPPRVNAVVKDSKRLFTNPLFVATVVGTAVAIPVAIANSDDDDPAS